MKYREMCLALQYNFVDGMYVDDIVKRLGVCKSTVERWVNNIEKTHSMICKYENDQSHMPIILEYRARGYSLARIGRILKRKPQDIDDLLIKHQIEESRKQFPELANKSDADKLRMAIKLRKEAYSYRDIAIQILDMKIAKKAVDTITISKAASKSIDKLRSLKIGDGIRETYELKNKERVKQRESLVSNPVYRDGAETVFISKKFNVDGIKCNYSTIFNSVVHACRCIKFLKEVHGFSDKSIGLEIIIRSGSSRRECIKYWRDRLPIDKPKFKIHVSKQINEPGIPKFGKLHLFTYGGNREDIRESVAYAIEYYNFKREPWIIGRREFGRMFGKTSQAVYNMMNGGWLKHYYSGAGGYLYFVKDQIIKDLDKYYIKRGEWDIKEVI